MKEFLREKELAAEKQARDLSQKRGIYLAKFPPTIINNGLGYQDLREKQLLDQEYLDALDRSGVRPEIMDDRGRFTPPSPPIYGPRIAQMRNAAVQKEILQELAQRKDRSAYEQMGRMTNGNDKMQDTVGTRLKQMFKKKK